MAYSQLVLAVCLFPIVFGADPKITIKQTFPYTTIVNGHKTMVVEKDTDCFLACVASNKPSGKSVQWLVQNFNTNTTVPIASDTDSQAPFKYQIDKPDSNKFRLKIQNVQISDNALFICRVQLGMQQIANDSRMIVVVQLPQIIDIYTSSDTTAEEGDRIELTCAASGIPTPIITWQLAGGGILPTGGREYTAPKLLIDSVNRNHKGDYKCIAQNKAGKDVRRIYLNVKFQPEVKANAREVFQSIGASKELKCEAKGNPIPTEQQVLWYREGVPLEAGGKFQFKNYFGSNYVLMKLLINDIADSDFGEYRCYAENSEGNGNTFVRLSRSGNSGTNGAAPLVLRLATFILSVSITLSIMFVH